MSLYGNNYSNLDTKKSFENFLFVYIGIKIGKVTAILLFAIAFYNLFLTLIDYEVIALLIDNPKFIALVAWNVISVLLLIYFCFAKSYAPIIPLIAVCALQLLGWATAHIEMTQYYYSENKLTLIKNEYLNYFDSIKVLPHSVINIILDGISLNSIKIFHTIEEFAKIVFLCIVLQQKRKYLAALINN